MLGSIFTWHAFSPYVFYFSKTWDLCRMKIFSEVVAVVPKFHYLLSAATECVTKLRYFLKWNFYVEEEVLLLCGLLWCSFQRNSYNEVQSEQWCCSYGVVKLCFVYFLGFFKVMHWLCWTCSWTDFANVCIRHWRQGQFVPRWEIHRTLT